MFTFLDFFITTLIIKATAFRDRAFMKMGGLLRVSDFLLVALGYLWHSLLFCIATGAKLCIASVLRLQLASFTKWEFVSSG